ncbi:MobC family plasmid mobilization relaxosome protein [Streptomyces sp. NPDC052015]|uniref:MobC family plasmid mobilization relaxosome protein n=1 Tax=Streptomyces sp. NPDC052015 TaxID=3154755 RepID=UPI00342C4E42
MGEGTEMAGSSAGDGRRRAVVRRREREAGGPRDLRIKISYNDAEITIVRAAADRDNTALASWVGTAALAVAKETVVPVSADAKDVLQEVLRSRAQLRRVGNNVNQIARVLNSDGEVSDAQLRAALDALEAAVRRVDAATVQLMRERRPRS